MERAKESWKSFLPTKREISCRFRNDCNRVLLLHCRVLSHPSVAGSLNRSEPARPGCNAHFHFAGGEGNSYFEADKSANSGHRRQLITATAVAADFPGDVFAGVRRPKTNQKLAARS